MKIFLDANVLVSVVNKEYPLFTHSSRILSLTDNKKFEVFTSPICLAITFYFAEKKHRTKLARQKISMLGEHLSISGVTESSVKKTIKNPAINDFEAGLEYYAAKESGCQCIITEDINDFYFSDLDILTCESFFLKYLVK
ncbi:MAG: PIN domain-containing protein [Chitinophagaceae bacterium]